MKNKIEVQLQEWMGSDISIANAAWTSTYDKDKREDKYDDPEKVESIVRRMIDEGHTVPIESVIFRFWIRHPIFDDRQHMTHRIASHNGLSGRYRTMPNDWYHIPDDVVKTLNSITNSYGHHVSETFDRLVVAQFDFYNSILNEAKKAEKAYIITNQQYKRVREIARGVIGTAAMTERTTIMNLHSFANYQRLRNSDHAQAEIREVAQKMLALVEEKNICPIAIDALKRRNWRMG